MDYQQFKRLEFRRQFFKVFGAQISVFDPNSNNLVGFIKMKAFKLKDEIHLYTDQTRQHEILGIKSRNVIDFGATYDVYDSASGQPFFSLRRKGLRSAFVRDHWDLYDTQGNAFGSVQETSSELAIMRRYLEFIPFVGDIAGLIFMLIPQTYSILYHGHDPQNPQVVGTITHQKNPIVVKMTLDTTQGHFNFDNRINIAIVSLLSIIDASKNG